MASASCSEEDLTCPVCQRIFFNPVVLTCRHNACEDCIQRYWYNNPVKQCPVCGRRSSMDYPLPNFSLRNQCEIFLQKRSSSSSGAETVCSLHKGKLKLFCLDDQQLLCLLCRESSTHANHRFCPVDEATINNKETLGAQLKPLQERLRRYELRKQNLYKTDEDLKIQTQRTEQEIKREFEELHQLLLDEKAARLNTAREEERWTSQRIKDDITETSRQVSSLKFTIRDIEKQMSAEDVSFLQNFNDALQRAQSSLSAPELAPPVTSDLTNLLSNLKVSVLQKMQENAAKASDVNIDNSTRAHTLPRPYAKVPYLYEKSNTDENAASGVNINNSARARPRPHSYAEVSEKTLSFHRPVKYNKDKYPNSGGNSSKIHGEIQQEDSWVGGPGFKRGKTSINIKDRTYERPPVPTRPSSFKTAQSGQTSHSTSLGGLLRNNAENKELQDTEIRISSVQSTLNKQKSQSATSLLINPIVNVDNKQRPNPDIRFSSVQTSLNKQTSRSTTSLTIDNTRNERHQHPDVQYSSVQSAQSIQSSRSSTSLRGRFNYNAGNKEIRDPEIRISSVQTRLNRQSSRSTTSLTIHPMHNIGDEELQTPDIRLSGVKNFVKNLNQKFAKK